MRKRCVSLKKGMGGKRSHSSSTWMIWGEYSSYFRSFSGTSDTYIPVGLGNFSPRNFSKPTFKRKPKEMVKHPETLVAKLLTKSYPWSF